MKSNNDPIECIVHETAVVVYPIISKIATVVNKIAYVFIKNVNMKRGSK